MRRNGLIGLDRTIAIEAKLDAVMNKLSSNERRNPNYTTLPLNKFKFQLMGK